MPPQLALGSRTSKRNNIMEASNQGKNKFLKLFHRVGFLTPVLAILAALAVSATMLLLQRDNLIQVYVALYKWAFGSPNAIADTMVKATPLLFFGECNRIAVNGSTIHLRTSGLGKYHQANVE